MYIKYFLLVLTFFIISCGGGGGGSSSNNSQVADVELFFLDTFVEGLGYECGSNSGYTDDDGRFVCPEGSEVHFSIGNVYLGSFTVSGSDQYITPSRLYGLENDNITDSRILNLIRLLQTIDDDGDPSNGIVITSGVRSSLENSSLDMSSAYLSEDDINQQLNNLLGRELVSANTALIHYISTISGTLGVSIAEEPFYYQQWYLEKNTEFYTDHNIDDEANINPGDKLRNLTGKGVKIAIIDNGLDMEHEELLGAVVDSYDIVTETTDVSHLYYWDFHGTAVTGIISARTNGKGIRGVASSADIVFLKHKEEMSDSETIELFNKAVQFGADIINCSWGTYDVSESVKDKIQELATTGRNGKGIIIVFASGNDNRDMGNDESAIPEVISVGSTDKDTLRAYYSNYGENLDVMAPGGDQLGIATTDYSGENGVAVYNENYILYNDFNAFIGTSGSAPIVTGVIALLLEKNPELTRAEIETLLKNNSRKVGFINYIDGRNNYYGYGLINLSGMIDSIE